MTAGAITLAKRLACSGQQSGAGRRTLAFAAASGDTGTSFVVDTPVTVILSARDANGDALRYDWSATTAITVPANTADLPFDYTPTSVGVFAVTVVVSDGLATTTVTARFNVLASDPLAGVQVGSRQRRRHDRRPQ